nr:uncharacterized protein LOC131788688 [Pocillopora verrucosa]
MARDNKFCSILLLFFVICAVSDGLLVTLLSFSGRPNVWWNVPDNHQLMADIRSNLTEARDQRATYTLTMIPPRLGYKGLVIGFGELAVGAASRKLQLVLLDSIPDNLLPAAYINRMKREVDAVEPKKRLVLGYNPFIWNLFPIVLFNNCYNYANNRMTHTFAQPGRGSGAIYAGITGALVETAAVNDGLRVIANPQLPDKSPDFVVALVVEPNVDFHWYVLNHHGLWSHKPGQTAAVNWDNAGAPINNVPACNMGNYQFRSYMATNYLTTIQ